MRDRYIELQEVAHLRIECDICGKVEIDKACEFKKCSICGKDICAGCCTDFYITGGDYADHWACPKHKNTVKKIYNQYNEMIDKLPDIDDMIEQAKE